MDVAVVGAGLAGLNAAQILVAAGASVLVLEARQRVGGRTFSQRLGESVFDLGGQWIGPTQHRMLALAQRVGATTFPTYDRGRKILDLGGTTTTYRGTVPSLPLHSLVELQLAMGRIDRMRRKLSAADPWTTARAIRWDSQTVEQWKCRTLRTRRARAVFDAAVRVVFGAEPAELSLLYFLFYTAAAGGLDKLVAIEGGAQQTRLVGGAQQLAQGVADDLGARLLTGCPVCALEQGDGAALVRTVGRGTFRARRVVVAVPPMLSAAIEFRPALPVARQRLAQRMPMGATVKCLFLYEEAFWRRNGLSGEVVSDDLASVIFDNTSGDGAQPALLAFVVGQNGGHWSTMPAHERRERLVRQLARCFGPEALRPTEYVEYDWSEEVWTGGCPIGYATPMALSSYGPALRKPFGSIHWAGTETATEWSGFMEGALQSGERAGAEVLAQL